MRVLRLEVSVYNVYITYQFKPHLLKVGREVKPLVEVTVNSKEENSEDYCPNLLPRIWTPAGFVSQNDGIVVSKVSKYCTYITKSL